MSGRPAYAAPAAEAASVEAGRAVLATVGGLINMWKHSSAHAAILSEGIAKDPALMRRFLSLPKP